VVLEAVVVSMQDLLESDRLVVLGVVFWEQVQRQT
jgi:hypothetical protein